MAVAQRSVFGIAGQEQSLELLDQQSGRIGDLPPVHAARQTDVGDQLLHEAVRLQDLDRGHVRGYTIVNDVTARDLQQKHRQWFIGKSMDTFCPMGPWIVTTDEVDATSLTVKCWINGELRQDAVTSDLIFDIPTIIATLSAGMTLQPGDVIATGTPAGVGIGFSPPRFLVPGDLMKIEIGGTGTLKNRIAGV